MVARLKKTFKMACKYVNGQYIYFISLAAYGIHPVFMVVGTFIF
jgi:hypothetical protein